MQRLNVVEQSTEAPMNLLRWFRRPRRVDLQRENELLRQQLDDQSRELAQFGSLRERVGTMEPALRQALIEGMSHHAAVAEHALAADLKDELDMSTFEMDALSAGRASARNLVETALALGEQKKSSNEP